MGIFLSAAKLGESAVLSTEHWMYSEEIAIQRDAMMLRLRQETADAAAKDHAIVTLRNQWLGCNETHL